VIGKHSKKEGVTSRWTDQENAEKKRIQRYIKVRVTMKIIFKEEEAWIILFTDEPMIKMNNE